MVIGAFLLSRLVDGVVDGVWLQSVLWYVQVGAVIRFAWKVRKWWNEIIIVTNKRFVIVTASGVIVKPITQVTDVEVSFVRPVVGQLLGFGTLRVKSAVQNLEIKYLPKPEEISYVIPDLISGEKRQTRSHMLLPPRPRRRGPW
jgi:hypothetical protein